MLLIFAQCAAQHIFFRCKLFCLMLHFFSFENADQCTAFSRMLMPLLHISGLPVVQL